MLFCLASGNDWQRAGVTDATAQHLLVRGLIADASTPARFKLTPLGRDVLAALLKPPVDEQDGRILGRHGHPASAGVAECPLSGVKQTTFAQPEFYRF